MSDSAPEWDAILTTSQEAKPRKIRDHVAISLIIMPILSIFILFEFSAINSLVTNSDSSSPMEMVRNGAVIGWFSSGKLEFFLATATAIVLGVIFGRNVGGALGYSPVESADVNDQASNLALLVGVACELVAVLNLTIDLAIDWRIDQIMEHVIYIGAAVIIAAIATIVRRSRAELLLINVANLGRMRNNELEAEALFRETLGRLAAPRKVDQSGRLKPRRTSFIAKFAIGWILYLTIGVAVLGFGDSSDWMEISIGVIISFFGVMIVSMAIFGSTWGRKKYLYQLPMLVYGLYATLFATIAPWSPYWKGGVDGFDIAAFIIIFTVPMVVAFPGFPGPKDCQEASWWSRLIGRVPVPFIELRREIARRHRSSNRKLIRDIRTKVEELSRQVDVASYENSFRGQLCDRGCESAAASEASSGSVLVRQFVRRNLGR